ncbi:hypothetical protein HY768_03520 [candidate division TA06 bacterium]|uniref:Uncharacterized protein n=1 Tax=candidate division TA06 bacterium TaxID=2250710 RepID=A0A933MJS7_UNCT6|nr:hypothetical protein [candidate division TA06 bacterium]
MKIIALAVCIFSIVAPAYARIAKFKSEKVVVTINSGWAAVNGVYWMQAQRAPARLNIFYPFPKGRWNFPENVKASSISQSGNISELKVMVSPDSDGVYFNLVFPDTFLLQLQVSYRQALKGNEFCYILKSTQEWGLPLERAEFEISIPVNLKRQNINYKPDSIIVEEKRFIYKIVRKSFLPKEDIWIRWEK